MNYRIARIKRQWSPYYNWHKGSDIAFAVNDVSRFNSNFGKTHWTAVKRIFQYLKGTMDWKLRYDKTGNSQLIGFSYADWASDVDKRHSCTGYVSKLSWSSKR